MGPDRGKRIRRCRDASPGRAFPARPCERRVCCHAADQYRDCIESGGLSLNACNGLLPGNAVAKRDRSARPCAARRGHRTRRESDRRKVRLRAGGRQEASARLFDQKIKREAQQATTSKPATQEEKI